MAAATAAPIPQMELRRPVDGLDVDGGSPGDDVILDLVES
jgi:hypothetical protein